MTFFQERNRRSAEALKRNQVDREVEQDLEELFGVKQFEEQMRHPGELIKIQLITIGLIGITALGIVKGVEFLNSPGAQDFLKTLIPH